MSRGKWYPIKRASNKRAICYCCDGWGTKNDARTGEKRVCAGCKGTGRLKPAKRTI